jgi:hypothetical protein
MRNFMDKWGVLLFIVLLLVGGLFLWIHSRPSTRPENNFTKAFFVDEETGVESVNSIDAIPPLPGQGGKPTVVRAMKFSCEGGKNPRTLYLLKYTPEAQAELQSLPPDSPRRSDVITSGELIRSPAADSEWVPATSSQTDALRIFPDCPSGQMVEVFPKK